VTSCFSEVVLKLGLSGSRSPIATRETTGTTERCNMFQWVCPFTKATESEVFLGQWTSKFDTIHRHRTDNRRGVYLVRLIIYLNMCEELSKRNLAFLTTATWGSS